MSIIPIALGVIRNDNDVILRPGSTAQYKRDNLYVI